MQIGIWYIIPLAFALFLGWKMAHNMRKSCSVTHG